MTTVNVILTPGIDTDQGASAQAQINAAPDGTAANPTIINMPAGRYRIDGASGSAQLRLLNRNHIRWTCLAGVPTYPNPPTDAQAFVAYTDQSSADNGFAQRTHFNIQGCTNVIGSFMRVDGPNTTRRAGNPLYAGWWADKESEHAFALRFSTDCGWEDCTWYNVYGDGIYIGQQGSNRNLNCHAYRLSGLYAGRMNIGLTNGDDTELIDITGKFSGFAGFDIEPNSADDRVWGAYCERIHMDSYFYPFTFHGGSSTHPAKKNITLKDSTVIGCATVGHNGLDTESSSAGTLIIDGFTDMRNRNSIGMKIDGSAGFWWDDVIIKNCRVRGYPNTATTYAMRIQVNNSATITNNNLNGTVTDGGFDNLVAFTAVPPIYTHYGNRWAMDTQTDGPPPVTLAATPGQITVVGGTATIDVVPAPLPQPAFIPSFVGGAPFRLRSQKGWGRLRGAAGARLRGTEGPAERHPMRVGSATGRSRLRSAQYPSYLRSMEPTPNPQTFLSVNSGSIGIEGGTAALATTLQATSGHLSMAMGTATTSVVGTVYTLAATSGALTFSGGTATLSPDLAATSGQLVLSGSASLNRGIPETSGHVSLAGGTALLRISLAATSGTLSLVGGSAGFNGQVTYTATSGTMTLSGGTATLRITTATTSGQVSITGGTATLSLGKIIHATPGELAILGGQTGLHTLYAVDTGTIVISGGTAELGGNTVRNLHATGGTITITGGTAHLTIGSPYPEWPMGELAPEWEMVG